MMFDTPRWHRLSGEALARAKCALEQNKGAGANDAVYLNRRQEWIKTLCQPLNPRQEWINDAYHARHTLQRAFLEWRMQAAFSGKPFPASLPRALAHK